MTDQQRRRRQRRSWGKIRRLPSKRYQASYIGPDLQRHVAPTTYTARMDAEGWLRDERRLIETQAWTPPALRAEQNQRRGKTFHEYATSWIEQRPLKPRTRKGYAELLAKPLAPLHRLPLAMLDAAAVRHWHAGLSKSTPTRNAHAYGLLSAIATTALGDGLLSANACTIRGAMTTKPKREAIVLSPNEIAKLAVTVQPPQLRAAVLILGWCGPRWGELIELRRKDISPDCSVIHVARGATHRNRECFIGTPKSGRIRTVTVPPHIRADIADHLQHHVGADSEALLLVAPRGCHYSEKTMRDNLAPAQAAIGKTGVRIHDLRHTACTMAAKVATQAALQARLGHSTPTASARYQHVAQGEDDAIAVALSALAAKDTDTLSALASELDADSAT